MEDKYTYDAQRDRIIDGKLEFAKDNMKHLLADVDVKGTQFVRLEELDERGYFGFLVWKDRHAFPILMPGSPLHYVREMDFLPRMNQIIYIQIGEYYEDSRSWSSWSFIVENVQNTMQGKGYNPRIEELEEEIDELESKIQDLQEQVNDAN